MGTFENHTRSMREKKFVEQGREKWSRFEELTSKKGVINPEEFTDLYSQITDDLSYARTQYPKRSIRVYLNGLAQNIYLKLNRRRGDKSRKFFGFWTKELPLALFQARRELNISLIFFLVSMAIGILSSIHDPEFADLILTPGYVEMTEENIEKGDPMGVYKKSEEFDMFFAITLNNLFVAFRTFVLGAFFGVGTLVIMLYNGIMVGTFQYFFIERDLLRESFLTIWMHGAIEISSIVIAGAAGLTLGRGLLFPGTLPRRQSFLVGARRSIKIMVGLVPLFIFAGFIEGFFTRLTEMPDFIRGSFIAACFIFVGTYFWLFPWMQFRGTNIEPYDPSDLVPDAKELPDLNILRKNKEIFTSTFVVFRLALPRLLLLAGIIALIYPVLFLLVNGFSGLELVDYYEVDPFALFGFHNYETFPFSFVLNWLLISAVILFSLRFFKESYPTLGLKINGRIIVNTLIVTCLFELSILSDYWLVIILGIAAIPFLVFWLVLSSAENSSISQSFSSMLQILRGTKRHVFITFLSISVISVLFLTLLASPFTWFYVEILQWNIDAEVSTKANIAVLTLIAINHFGLALVLPLTVYSQLLEYFSAKEAKSAKTLERRVSGIGVKRRAYGLEKE